MSRDASRRCCHRTPAMRPRLRARGNLRLRGCCGAQHMHGDGGRGLTGPRHYPQNSCCKSPHSHHRDRMLRTASSRGNRCPAGRYLCGRKFAQGANPQFVAWHFSVRGANFYRRAVDQLVRCSGVRHQLCPGTNFIGRHFCAFRSASSSRSRRGRESHPSNAENSGRLQLTLFLLRNPVCARQIA